MTDMPRPEDRLEALETHAAHQAQVIDDLNAAVAAQWSVIETLQRQVRGLSDRIAEAETPVGGLTQRPPHY